MKTVAPRHVFFLSLARERNEVRVDEGRCLAVEKQLLIRCLEL